MAYRRVKRAVKKAIKKRYRKRTTGAIRTGRIARDVMMLKKLVNAEKKRYYIGLETGTLGDSVISIPKAVCQNGPVYSAFSATPFPFGQVICNTATEAYAGWTAWDATPDPSNGTGYLNKSGSSIKLSSSYMKMQLTAQNSASVNVPIKIKFMLIQVLGTPLGGSDATARSASLLQFIETIFLDSTFAKVQAPAGTVNHIVDYNSQPDPDYRGQFKILFTKTKLIPAEQMLATIQVKEWNFGIRYGKTGHHIRWSKDSTTLTSGQIIMFMCANAGNCGSTTYTGSGVGTIPTPASQTGVNVNFNLCHYFYDN